VSETDKPPPELIVPDPLIAMREAGKSPEIAGLLAWLIPGAGHYYAGHKLKGIVSAVLILGLFVAGVGISKGECVSLREPDGHKFAFMGQIGAGLPTFLALAYNHQKLPGLRPGYVDLLEETGGHTGEAYASHLPNNDTGLLFTMIAGLLNLLLVHDALSGVPGAINRRIADERKRRKIEKLKEELLAEEKAAADGDAPAADVEAAEAEGDAPAEADAPAAEADAEEPAAAADAEEPKPEAASKEDT